MGSAADFLQEERMFVIGEMRVCVERQVVSRRRDVYEDEMKLCAELQVSRVKL